MLMRVFTLRFNAALDGFDDSPLTEFIKDKQVLSLREHFFIRNETPYLAVSALFEPVRDRLPAAKDQSERRRQDDSWRQLLQEGDMPLFDSLRSWRAEQCKREGVPPYVICNNRQLAQIAAARPRTLGELMRIEGLGKAKAERYGQAMLALLAPSADHSQAEPPHRSQAPRGDAACDAPASRSGTQSVPPCVPTPSVGTIMDQG
jgi:ATP-dependent DNA helicase RecQ